MFENYEYLYTVVKFKKKKLILKYPSTLNIEFFSFTNREWFSKGCFTKSLTFLKYMLIHFHTSKICQKKFINFLYLDVRLAKFENTSLHGFIISGFCILA